MAAGNAFTPLSHPTLNACQPCHGPFADSTMNLEIKLLIGPVLLITGIAAAAGEPLDRRFGPDRERGYRSEREFDQTGRDFRNLDRANFLGAKPAASAEVQAPRSDLQHPPMIGQQK